MNTRFLICVYLRSSVANLKDSTMQVTDELIRTVVQEVLSHMRSGRPAPTNGKSRQWGVFNDVCAAVAAASAAQREFEQRGLDDRRKAIDCIRRICIDQAE